jgi:hypothetical protein
MCAKLLTMNVLGGFATNYGCVVSIRRNLKPCLNHSLNHSKYHSGGRAEHEHPIGCFQWSQQSPGRRHDHIAVTERRVVDRGVIKGRSEVVELAAPHKHQAPRSYLGQMRREGEHGGSRHYENVGREPDAGMTDSLLVTDELDNRRQRHGMNENCAECYGNRDDQR